jgi:hypothetical protein
VGVKALQDDFEYQNVWSEFLAGVIFSRGNVVKGHGGRNHTCSCVLLSDDFEMHSFL